MHTMRGRFASANVMIDEVDDSTRDQIQGILNHPAFAHTYIAIMPDCHAGKGCVIGFTMKLNDYVIPNIIGVDIGCGMLMREFPIQGVSQDYLRNLDNFIKAHIPFGNKSNQDSSASDTLSKEVRNVAIMIGESADKMLLGLGSLGGGNHFIEAGVNGAGNLCLTVHSGSRAFGAKASSFYQNRAKAGLSKFFIDPALYRDSEFLPIDSPDASDYFHALGVAQRFATENRKEMLARIELFLGVEPINEVESIHNFIAEDNVIRKGATSAREGELLLIPFNMADGVALCRGKGSSKFNFSAPHGAGRIFSRTQARKSLTMDDFQKRMDGVFTSTATIETLDEAPGAYKAKEVILENIGDTVDVIDFIKPIYNFKGGRE